MKLTERAKEYLKETKRVESWVLSLENIRKYLELNSINNQKICEIAYLYSGYHFTENGRKGLYIQFFSKKDILKNNEPKIYIEDDKRFFSIGEHSYAPFRFVVDELGAVYVETSEKNFIVSSSIENYIENNAYISKLSEYDESEYYEKIIDIKKFNQYVKRFYNKIKECSDEYNYIGKGQYGIIHKGIFLGSNNYYCKIYSKNQKNINYVLNELKKENIIK